MKYQIALAFTVFIFSGFAQASVLNMGSKVIEGKDGSPASIKWNEIQAKGEIVSDEMAEESTESTTIVSGKTTCTMKDSSFYRCETLN